MSRIRSHGNRDTELAMVCLFRREKIKGWRRHSNVLGKPDFVFPKQRMAIFVDGCFWHGCLAHSKPPKSNCEYWTTKLARNKRRDQIVGRKLRDQGWSVVRIWEHEIKDPGKGMRRLRGLLEKG